jgi:hypothetical protein
MCYDAETSITTYAIGSISSLLLLKSKKSHNKIAGTFFLFVSQMQLIEYLLWKDYTCNNYNKTISNIGSILNHAQPIILYFAIRYFNKNLSNTNKNIITSLISLYTLSLLAYSKNVYPLDCTSVTNTDTPHLEWSWSHKKNYIKFYLIFLITLILLSYFGFEKPYNHIMPAICLITYIISHSIYKDEKVVGAVWCWFAALVPFLLLIYDAI